MPSPREVTLSKKCKFLTPGALLLVKRTQRMIKSPYHGQTCEVKSPSYARPPSPPYPSGLTLIGALCVRNDRTKTSNRTPQLQIRIKGKEALRQIIRSYLHTSLCLQPGYSPVNCVQLCFCCSRLFHGLLPHILTCLHEVARSNLLLFDGGIAYPLIQPDYNLDISSWALWFACKGKT